MSAEIEKYSEKIGKSHPGPPTVQQSDKRKKRGRPPKAVTMADGTRLVETPTFTAEGTNTSDGKGGKAPTFEWFTCIIYPTFDPKHQAFLDYVCSYEREYAYILHDMDLDKDGKPKKAHVHVMFKHYSRVTLRTIRKVYLCWLEEHLIQSLSDPIQMALYLPHLTPDAITQNKYQYPIRCVKHTRYFESTYNRLEQNRNFVQNEKQLIAQALLEHKCDTLSKAYALLATLNVDDTAISEYMLVQYVRDVQYKIKTINLVNEKTYITTDHNGKVLDIQHEDYRLDPLYDLAYNT